MGKTGARSEGQYKTGAQLSGQYIDGKTGTRSEGQYKTGAQLSGQYPQMKTQPEMSWCTRSSTQSKWVVKSLQRSKVAQASRCTPMSMERCRRKSADGMACANGRTTDGPWWRDEWDLDPDWGNPWSNPSDQPTQELFNTDCCQHGQ